MAISYIFCVLLALYLQDTVNTMTTPPAGCSNNGHHYPEGASYKPSACRTCFCNQGREICAVADCFFTPCVDSVHKPGVCCPVCPNGSNCWYGKRKIPAGKDVKIDEHTTCRCQMNTFGSNHQAVCTMTATLQTVKPVILP